MPLAARLRKRSEGSSRPGRKGPVPNDKQLHSERLSTHRPIRPSLASKLKKQMLGEPAQDVTEEKRIRTSLEHSLERDDSRRGVACDFPARQCVPRVYTSQICERLLHSSSLTHCLYALSLGFLSPVNKKSVLSPVIRELQDLHLFRTASPFDRRVTALEWHPTSPRMLLAGSKGGDLILWNTLQHNLNDHFIHGTGAGGSIQAIKVWPWNSECVLTASIDGRVMVRDWAQRHCRVLSDTFNCLDYWYCCVDVSVARQAVVTGDNVGNTKLLSLDGKQLWTHRLHKQKVTHAEFSPRDDWLMCTASTDTTVKVWDLRKVTGPHSALYVLKHDKPVNSAYFSRTDGGRLLTTDQHSQIRVYNTSGWHLERTVLHPHRFFQHITPIKATWHPLQDLVVVGRYPSKDFPGYTENELRTIDTIDATTGKVVCQLHDPSAPGIVSLNKFNDRGDYLASGMGLNLLLWGRHQEVEDKQRSALAQYPHADLDPMRAGGHRARSQSAPRRRPDSKQSKTKKNGDVKVKVETKVKTKTKKH